MKKAIIFVIWAICLAGGIALAVIAMKTYTRKTFDSVVKDELFQDLPLYKGKDVSFSTVEDVGGENYLLWAYDTTKEEYDAYLKLLEKNNYVKFADNGSEGIEGYVYTANYTKGDRKVIVSYLSKMKDVMITVTEEQEYSNHLIFQDEFVAENIPGAKTRFILPELSATGNSFVFQLKNGHYIVNDGGYEKDLLPLIDLLEEYDPNPGKPVVEAWVVSHAHMDHMGCLKELTSKPEVADRIIVEGLYFTEACEAANEERRGTTPMAGLTNLVKLANAPLRNADGDVTPFYRFRTGERYYFSDITMDVVYTQDVLNYKEWSTSNAQSTVLMYTIEGQKVFITADTDYECQVKTLEMYDDDYFNVTIYQAPHHSGNVNDRFIRHLTVQTVVSPSKGLPSGAGGMISRYSQFEHLKDQAQEALSFLEGGIIFTFPYSVGTYERLPLIDWTKYDPATK